MSKYSLIVMFANWKASKIHISKEIDTMDSLCGKNLGFDFGIANESGAEHDIHLYLNAEEINAKKAMCKKCLSVLNKSK